MIIGVELTLFRVRREGSKLTATVQVVDIFVSLLQNYLTNLFVYRTPVQNKRLSNYHSFAKIAVLIPVVSGSETSTKSHLRLVEGCRIPIRLSAVYPQSTIRE